MSAIASKLSAMPRKQLIMMGVLAALVLGAVLYFFVLSGGNEVVPASAPAPAPATTPEPDVEADVDKDADKMDKKKPLQTNTLLGARDVFEALIDESEGGGGEGTDVAGEVVDDGSSTTTEPPTTSTDPGTTPVVPPVTPPDDPADDPDDPDDPAVVKTGWTVRLLTIYSDDGVKKAIVETKNRKTGKTTTHKLVEGQRFANNFKLVSINNDDTASFLYGDETFSLAENQKVTKK